MFSGCAPQTANAQPTYPQRRTRSLPPRVLVRGFVAAAQRAWARFLFPWLAVLSHYRSSDDCYRSSGRTCAQQPPVLSFVVSGSTSQPTTGAKPHRSKTMGTQRTQQWLVANTNQTDPNAEWFLAMWHTQSLHELCWKDQAEELQAAIANPTTYEDLEEQFFDSQQDDDDREMAVEFARDFYGE